MGAGRRADWGERAHGTAHRPADGLLWQTVDLLLDGLGLQAISALKDSPGARAYYDQQRARGIGHRAALRQLGN